MRTEVKEWWQSYYPKLKYSLVMVEHILDKILFYKWGKGINMLIIWKLCFFSLTKIRGIEIYIITMDWNDWCKFVLQVT